MRRAAFPSGAPALALLLLLLTLPRPAPAFVPSGDRWPGASSVFHVRLVNGTGSIDPISRIAWNDAFEDAMAEWSAETPFQYRIVDGFSDPCSPFDERNGVDFAFSVCEDAFGSATLAVTTSSFLGAMTVETDIVFNEAKSWSIHDGSLHPFLEDFRRVALHELGHALGLAHEDAVPAIMNARVNDIDSLRADDRAAAQALYGPCPAPASIPPTAERHGRLSVTDCFATELGLDVLNTLVDRHRVVLPSSGRLTAELRSSAFDAFLMLFDGTGLVRIAEDDDGAGRLDARLDRELAAGSYLLVPTSFFDGSTGGYQLSTTFVPEPGEGALALAALGAVGGIARLRRGGVSGRSRPMERVDPAAP